MKDSVDCLFIGHNEMWFEEYEKMVRLMGVKSEAYRDLNLNFVQYQNKKYTAPEIFNLFLFGHEALDNSIGPFHLGNLFSPAIAYLGSYLSRRGMTFDYVNSFQYQKEELAEKLSRNNIGLIAIITTLYVSVFPVLEIVSFVRTYNKTVKIVIGGPFISTQVRAGEDEASLQYFFKKVNADYYVYSAQGETALSKLITALKDGHFNPGIDNLYYYDGHRYKKNRITAENNRLAENMVNWRLLADRLHKFAAVRTSISCPFACSFCGFPEHAGEFQTIDVELIEKELNEINSLGRVTSLNFIDDTFNIPRKRFQEILKMMIKNKYTFKWNSHFRCQYADRETVELMKESGCEGVFLGIESGNQQILQNMNKAASVDDYHKGIALLKEYEITTYASFIIGFPGETPKTVEDTLCFIKDNPLDFFRTQLWYCDKITPIWREREKYNIQGSQFSWSHATFDSRSACDVIDDVFLNIDQPLWVPQYNFEFAGIFNLLHRGLSLEQVKCFLATFNQGIRDRLIHPRQPECDGNLVDRFKDLLGSDNAHAFPAEVKNPLYKYEPDFEF